MSPVLAKYSRLFKPSFRLLCLATRGQGIMVAKGNPKQLWEIADLAKPDVRLVNRQENSGTRMLLELLLEQAGIDKRQVVGFENVEFTHAAVAAYIASQRADVGIGVEAAARQFNLDFVPLLTERYFLMFDQSLQKDSRFPLILQTMESSEFKAEVSGLPGYSPSLAVELQTPGEAFPSLE
jgi:molybdate-binding protein